MIYKKNSSKKICTDFNLIIQALKKIILLNRLLFGLPRKILAKGQNFYFFKRFDTKEVVGTAQVTFYDENSKIYINAFAVRPGLENQGFGTKMMDTLIDYFHFQNILLLRSFRFSRTDH